MWSSGSKALHSGSKNYPGPELRDANQIRLIRLLPGSGPIECEFLVVDIATPPPFEALSYTWGDSSDRGEILVRTPPSTAGATSIASNISVTVNCLAALQSLRTEKPRELWIDAICIDQINLGERHHQLSLMGRIFSRAAGVLIFLGDADEDSDLAMDYIHDLYSPDTSKWPASEESPNNDQLFNAVRRLFGRPWFRRVWVIQEALMAKEATVICGKKSFHWAAMRELCAMAANPPSENWHGERKPSLQTRDIPFVARARKGDFWPRASGQNQEENDEGPRLLPYDPFDRQIVTFETLCRSRGCEATDPRDKIYALLPLLSSTQSPVAIEPNYADPTEKVFVDCASYLLPYWGLQLLCAVQGPPATPGLPSWAPDWAIAPQRSILGGAGASQKGSLGRRDRWKDVLPWLSSDGGSSGTTSKTHSSLSALRAARLRFFGKGQSQSRGGGSRSEGYQHRPKVVVRDEASTERKIYELHTRGIFLGNIVDLASPCDAGNLEDFSLTEWVDMSKRLVPEFKRTDPYDPMAPKLFYEVVFAQDIGAGWYYYVDGDIRHHVESAKQQGVTGAQDSSEASRWRFDKTDFKASFGFSAIMWERCHSRRLFVTDTGYLGLGPLEARLGDNVYACPSANVPFVLRGEGGGSERLYHTLIGECFLEERMWDDIKSRNIGPEGLEELVLV